MRRISAVLVRVSLCMSRSKRIRTLLAWWSVTMRHKAHGRTCTITRDKSSRRLLLCALQNWSWLVQVRLQNVKKGIRLLTNLNHRRMDLALHNLERHVLCGRKVRLFSCRYTVGRAFAALKIVVEGLENASLEQQAIVLASTANSLGTPGHGQRRMKSSLRAWLGKGAIKVQIEICSSALNHWNWRKKASVRRFVQVSRFQGRRMINHALCLLEQWLQYAKRKKILRHTCIKIIRHTQQSSFSLVFERCY